MLQTAERVGFSLTELSELMGIKRHCVAYALEQYDIEPARRFGGLRIWTPDQLPAIRAAIARTTKQASDGATTLAFGTGMKS